ncbi:hypothetical protein CYY_004549 [Polysphondylium violaceum]|uniref:4-coumarate-CoA ligase n=1 Tax=Polysphondylium violaceum TaxID=133409 RepID=A0A8J4USY1_9MYCE|nr:hypothetical protein CYY_004549 [Polysphondylium violaceum]
MIIKVGKETYYSSKYPDVIIPEISAPELIIKSLKSGPSRTIIVDGLSLREYSSHEIAEDIEKAAKGFSILGLKKGEVVGIILPNVPEYSIVYHGVGLIGGISSLINPEYTVDELSKTLATVNPKFLVCTPAVYQRIKQDLSTVFPNVERVIVISVPNVNADETNAIAKESKPGLIVSLPQLLDNDGRPPKVPIDPKKDVAVIPFSSGTTGLFKGVCLTHFNVIANTYQTQVIETSTYRKNDTLMGILPFFHIYGLMLFLMLMLKQGYRVVVLPKFEPVKFLQLIERFKVSISFVVPPVALMFAKSPLIDNYDLSSLRVLFSGAAPLSDNVEREIVNRFKGNITIKQGYGMTEASPATMVNPYGGERSGSVGLLLPNQIAKIVSTDSGETLDIGARGEICVKGPNVMLGYYNNEKATQETIDKDGFLHTGDIGYVDEDGYYFVVDRVKELIKFKGFQIPPAELEALLLSHPMISDACVVGIDSGDVGEVPRAYVVLKPNQKLTDKELHEWVNKKVSNYKRFRGGIYFLNQIPKSATGKLLRKDLKNYQPAKL